MREIDGIPVYEITIDDSYSEGNELGIDMIAFTDSPAILTKGMAFKNVEKKVQFFSDASKMRIAAPAMIPMDIYRADEDGEYYVTFKAETIEQIYSKFMRNLTNKDVFNLEHKAEDKVPAYLLETLLIDSEPKQRMIKDEYSIDVPLGSMFIVTQVTDKDYFNELVKAERIGYSIEGFLGLKFNNQNNMTKERYELDGKFYDVVEGKLVPVAMEDEVPAVVEETPTVEVELEEAHETEEEVEMMEEPTEEEKVEEVEAEVNPEADAQAILDIVAPALNALREELMGLIADKANEEEVEEEVEMQEVKMSAFQKLSNYMNKTK